MARFKGTEKHQGMFLTINLHEQLLPGTFEWTVDYLINEADMSLFEQKYNNDAKGAAAYPPRVLLKAILYCYSNGILTSRSIEAACINHMITKALAENTEPDHSTIATFISSNSEAIKNLFAQVLLQCSKLKLLTGEMFAIDGCKLSSNASKEWSGKIEELTKKRDKLKKYIGRLLAMHQELDNNTKAKKLNMRFQKTMGDAAKRRKRSIQNAKKKLKKLNEALEKLEPRKGLAGAEVKSNITDNESALIKTKEGYVQGYNGISIADSANQVIICAGVTGSVAESGKFPLMLETLKENMKELTGKEEPLKKSIILGDTGYFAEDNLKKAAELGIEALIPDSQFRQRDPHFAEKKREKVKKKLFSKEDFQYNEDANIYICPNGKELKNIGETAIEKSSGIKYQSKGKDCIECPILEQCIKKRKSKKPADKKQKKRNPVRTLFIALKAYADAFCEKMRNKIDDPAYREIYSRRMQIIEPVFSDITYCKRMDRFTLRGEEKVDAQWKLYCIVHNIGKCIKPLAEKHAA
jgi:transposase